ncbi:ABC transporter ATP-binding protein [Romboutsia sp. 1001713B170207_170306_H8]|uniref:ABC transporter ATP-binding protein n=1 Tax=Romboutsia sp. 1001713B170207_170306_H8 TaxID=2787112 RepID=UPI00082110A5|nr:ABC transporter ATP-binding protein [Romboutsia sp. 1001713B170207_170306_H8]SCH86997.1 Glutathione import ATP-binding protein GsiA [uncultured Clostridium sp.]
MNTILKVENLYVNNAEVEILRDISLSIKKGEILGIVGESGSGKSTLIRALIQMMENSEYITNGDIYFKDKSLLNMSSRELRSLKGNEIGVIFQNPGSTLNPIRKIGKQFVEVLKSHSKISKKEALNKAKIMLEKVNLKDAECILHSYPFELSGGMKQRVAMALAMIMEPELLVADEPTSALDVTVQAQVVKEMMKLRDGFNTSIIIVTHSMGVVSHMVDKVAVMYAGSIIEYGDKEYILKNPKHPYTKALINAIPKLDGRVPVGIEGNPPSFKESLDGCRFAPRCKKASIGCRFKEQKLKHIGSERFIACTYVEEMEHKQNE